MKSKEVVKPQQKPSVIQSALGMALGTFSSRILGVVRDAVFFAIYSRTFTDAYSVAFRLPNLFRRLLGEGSLSVSFIPIYVEERRASPERAQALADATFSVLLALTLAITLLCFIFMDQIVNGLVGDPRGYAAVPGKIELTITLARVMIGYLVLVTLYAFYMAIANTLHYFFIPAIGPTLFNAANIVFFYLPSTSESLREEFAAWGVIAGGVLQVLTVLWLLWREGFLPRWTVKWRVPALGAVLRNMGPGLFGLGVFQVMTIVNTAFAARLSEGTQSYIYIADRVLELPQSLIAVSLGAALLPTFSELHASGQREKFLEEATWAVRLLLFLSVPAALGMWLLSEPIVSVLYERGAFSTSDVFATARVVEVYAVLLLFSSLSRVTAPAFYAMKNTWLPACVALFVLLVHIALGNWAVTNYGLVGLASTTAFSSMLNVLILQIFFRWWIGPLQGTKIFISLIRLIPAVAGMGVVVYYVFPFLMEAGDGLMSRLWLQAVVMGVTISGAMIVYFMLSYLFRSPEAERVVGGLLRRIRRKARVV